ncbi:hypothetical protein [Rhodoferax antarcticus]|nr:hypothetical protein [Rhodoferax antarcticus]
MHRAFEGFDLNRLGADFGIVGEADFQIWLIATPTVLVDLLMQFAVDAEV